MSDVNLTGSELCVLHAKSRHHQSNNPSSFAKPAGSAFLRVIIETHDYRLEMDTRCGSAQYIEARAIEAIRAGCVGIFIASPNEKGN